MAWWKDRTWPSKGGWWVYSQEKIDAQVRIADALESIAASLDTIADNSTRD